MKPLQVIGAGFGRTGTLSLKIALETLGFGPCYHMTEVIKHPTHVGFWHRAARGEHMDWARIFRGYNATVDWPACTFYEALMTAYPDAKLILTVRDPHKWYESTRDTIYMSVRAVPPRLKWILPPFARFIEMVTALIWQGTFHGRFDDREHAIEIFNQHLEAVKRIVPPERLLVFDVREGWEPLCAFLEVPIPEGLPFPHANDRRKILAAIQAVRVVAVALPAFIAGISYWYWKRNSANKHMNPRP